MSQNQIRKWAHRVVCLGFAALLPVGCNLFPHGHLEEPFLVGQPFGGEPFSSAEYPLTFKDGPKKGQDVAVAVFVEYALGTDFAFAGSEAKLASELVKKLPELAKERNQTFKVIDPARENSIDPKNPNWRLMYTSDWGRKHFVDFVLTVHMDKLTIYLPDSHNQFYEGQAEITVDVDEIDEAGKSKPKYHYVMPFKYPEAGTLDATQLPVTRFKQEFLEQLALEISMKHIPHRKSLLSRNKTKDE